MGCAYGTFIPSAAYRTIQQHCIEHREKWQPIAGLTVEEEGGLVLECSGGFQIVDYSPECGSEGIQFAPSRYYRANSQLFPDDLKNR